jgi:hypothetical protein
MLTLQRKFRIKAFVESQSPFKCIPCKCNTCYTSLVLLSSKNPVKLDIVDNKDKWLKIYGLSFGLWLQQHCI